MVEEIPVEGTSGEEEEVGRINKDMAVVEGTAGGGDKVIGVVVVVGILNLPCQCNSP